MSNMYDCPYVKGLKCNQKPNICDKGRFEPRCLMMLFRQIRVNSESQIEDIRKRGIEDVVLWLFDNNFIREEWYNLSVSDIVDRYVVERGRELEKIRKKETKDTPDYIELINEK